MRITRKGQVTIPKAIRELLSVQPGDEVDFVLEAHNRVYIKVNNRETPGDRFATLRGTATVNMSTDEIMALTRPR